MMPPAAIYELLQAQVERKPPPYPPVGELNESIADLADFTHAEEAADGRVTLFAEREPAGYAAYSARLIAPSRAWAWDHLGAVRQALRGVLEVFERRDGIERRF